MAERRTLLDHSDLERALVDLGGRLEYPPTPSLTTLVGDRLASRSRRRWAWPTFPFARALAYAVVALLLLGGALLAISPEARTAVADRLGLRGVTIIQTPAEPAPTPLPLGPSLRLGEPMTLDEARARVSHALAVPAQAELGLPDEVYLDESVPGGKVTFLYRARPGLPATAETAVGLLAIQFPGELNPTLINKSLGPGTSLTQVVVNGGTGYWLEGQPHFVMYRDSRGQILEETLRLAGNTLIWEQGDLTLRLEGALTKDEALRIATSMR